MTDPENPRAFPSAAIDDRFGGMTLRDAAALAALPAIITTAVGNKIAPEIIAQGAYLVADAMLAERSKP